MYFPASESQIAQELVPTLTAGSPPRTAGELEAALRDVYCGTFAAEFSHLASRSERCYWVDVMEKHLPAARAVGAGRSARHAFRQMAQAEEFERFLGVKLPSLKRYSGEGAESMHPLLSAVFDGLAQRGSRQVVVGMPHRGRLAFLAGVMQYPV